MGTEAKRWDILQSDRIKQRKLKISNSRLNKYVKKRDYNPGLGLKYEPGSINAFTT